MTVQIQPAKPNDQHNGLADLEADLMRDPEQQVTAIVTYRVAKLVDDRKKNDNYPVLYVEHIEPVVGEMADEAQALLARAYKSRTGEGQLDFGALETVAGGDDE